MLDESSEAMRRSQWGEPVTLEMGVIYYDLFSLPAVVSFRNAIAQYKFRCTFTYVVSMGFTTLKLGYALYLGLQISREITNLWMLMSSRVTSG